MRSMTRAEALAHFVGEHDKFFKAHYTSEDALKAYREAIPTMMPPAAPNTTQKRKNDDEIDKEPKNAAKKKTTDTSASEELADAIAAPDVKKIKALINTHGNAIAVNHVLFKSRNASGVASPLYYCFMSILAAEWPMPVVDDPDFPVAVKAYGLTDVQIRLYDKQESAELWGAVLDAIRSAINAASKTHDTLRCLDGTDRTVLMALLHAGGDCTKPLTMMQLRQRRIGWIARQLYPKGCTFATMEHTAAMYAMEHGQADILIHLCVHHGFNFAADGAVSTLHTLAEMVDEGISNGTVMLSVLFMIYNEKKAEMVKVATGMAPAERNTFLITEFSKWITPVSMGRLDGMLKHAAALRIFIKFITLIIMNDAHYNAFIRRLHAKMIEKYEESEKVLGDDPPSQSLSDAVNLAGAFQTFFLMRNKNKDAIKKILGTEIDPIFEELLKLELPERDGGVAVAEIKHD